VTLISSVVNWNARGQTSISTNFPTSSSGRKRVFRNNRAMKFSEQKRALACAVKAARAAGKLMRENLFTAKKVNAYSRHDIKLELDVRCQRLIERMLRSGFPKVALLGEEGISGDPKAA